MVHFHGGGFVIGDTSMCETHTNKWAVDTGVPLFSIDYRLAPKHPYPDPINDCYQAYVWLVTHAKE